MVKFLYYQTIFKNFHHILTFSKVYLVHISAGILVQLVAAGEDDESDLAVAEDRQLVGLLHHPELSLVKRHLRLFNLANFMSHVNRFDMSEALI